MKSRLCLVLAALSLLCNPSFAQATKITDSKARTTKTEAVNSENKSENKVDLNAASRKDLESLPGIGAASAKKIIAGRPYSDISGLAKAGIPAKTIRKITPLVTLGASPSVPYPKVENCSGVTADANTNSATAIEADKASQKTSKSAKAKESAAQAPPQKGMVWVNLDSGVYHKEGARWYGKTKNGKFMNEADAIKAGYRSAKR